MEKSEISLCEGIAVARVIDTLEQAQITLESKNGRPHLRLTGDIVDHLYEDLPWRDALLLRLDLRKV